MTTTDEMIDIAEFIEDNGVTMRAEQAGSRPNFEAWGEGFTHWRTSLFCGPEELQTYYSMGSAHTSSPTLSEVLDSLAGDAQGVECADDFETWAGDYGYSTDSISAYKTYQACCVGRDDLKKLLGDLEFKTLLYKIERL
jgi:hypothetical protein